MRNTALFPKKEIACCSFVCFFAPGGFLAPEGQKPEEAP